VLLRWESEDKLGGSHPKECCLMLNPFTMSWGVMMVSFSLEIVFGKTKVPLRVAFLLG
jgi:hypothetical protein